MNENVLIRVGGGRGFVWSDLLRKNEPPFVVTAAHCLPKMPPAHLFRYLHEKTFRVLGHIGKKPSVFANVLFCDPVADVAILGQPDPQELSDQAEEYEQLLNEFVPLSIAVPREEGKGFLFDLKGKRRPITYTCWQGIFALPVLQIDVHEFESGMSGSPVIDERGRAIALVSTDLAALPSLVSSIPSRLWPTRKQLKLAELRQKQIARRLPVRIRSTSYPGTPRIAPRTGKRS